jgi:hypothetical protein
MKSNLKLKLRIIEIFGSQAKFSRKLGIYQPKISWVVTGHWNLDEKEQKMWAEALMCKSEEIFSTEAIE